jgi:DNA-binding transcriptional ArsR family regulator
MSKIQGKFYPLQHDEWLRACKELSPSARDILYYIRTLDPYANGIEITASAIARSIGVHRSTVSRALKQLDQQGFIDLELIRVTVRILGQGMLVTETLECNTIVESQHCCNMTTLVAEQQQTLQSDNIPCNPTTSVATAQQSEPETKSEQGRSAAKTIKIVKKKKTNQIQDGGEVKIPTDLVAKLEELEIPLDNKVKSAIASHHISQAYGAANHIENTRETVSNPRGVFLYQIGKQPVEPMGSRGREYRACEMEGWTLDYLQWMYPNTWRDAAEHFGIAIADN